jgi:mRNA capping enzyme, beta chain
VGALAAAKGQARAATTATAPLELEWSFGALDDGYEPGLSGEDFHRWADHLLQMFKASATATGTAGRGRVQRVDEWCFDDVVHADGTRTRQGTLVSTTADAKAAPPATVMEAVRKARLVWSDQKVVQRKYDGRLALKSEQPLNPDAWNALLATQGGPRTRRSQTRRSFWVDAHLRIDLSIVHQEPPHPQLALPNGGRITRYEGELELLPSAAEALSPGEICGLLWDWIVDTEDLFDRPAAALPPANPFGAPFLVLYPLQRDALTAALLSEPAAADAPSGRADAPSGRADAPSGRALKGAAMDVDQQAPKRAPSAAPASPDTGAAKQAPGHCATDVLLVAVSRKLKRRPF